MISWSSQTRKHPFSKIVLSDPIFFKFRLSHPNTLDDLKYCCGRKENNISPSKTHLSDTILFLVWRTSQDERRKIWSYTINSPDPQTTKMNNPRRIGPTGYFSSCGFWNRWEELHLNVTVKAKFKFHVSNEFHLSWRTGRPSRVWNTTHQWFGDISSRCNVLAVFFVGDTHSLLGWHFWKTIKPLQDQVQLNHNKAKL